MMLNLFLAYLDEESDKRLFEEMYCSYCKQMVSYSMTFVKDQDDAEDVVHSVFLRIAQKNWDTVREIKEDVDLRNYLLKSTKNVSLNFIKASKKDNVSLDNIMEIDPDNAQLTSDADFFECIIKDIDYNAVVNAIKSLSDKYKDVLYYHLVLDFPICKTAKLLGQSVSATKKQLVRGKKSLLSLLNTEGIENDGNK